MDTRTTENHRTTTDTDEEWARYLLQQVLGTEVRRTDRCGKDGDGRTDLAFELSDGAAIAEVVSTRDPQVERLGNTIARRRYTRVPELNWLWAVTPTPSTRVKDLRARLPQQLRGLEDRGVSQVLDHTTRMFGLPPELQSVPDCFAMAPTPDHPAGYMLMEPCAGGFPGGGDQAMDQLETFLQSRPDKATKLGAEATRLHREGVDVRHQEIVVLLELFSKASEAAFRFLVDGEDPAGLRPPALQEGVTGLWLIPLSYFPPACPVLRWTIGAQKWTCTRAAVTAPDQPHT